MATNPSLAPDIPVLVVAPVSVTRQRDSGEKNAVNPHLPLRVPNFLNT